MLSPDVHRRKNQRKRLSNTVNTMLTMIHVKMGKENDQPSPLHPNVARQTAQRQPEALDKPDNGPHDEQRDAEKQNPLADHCQSPL